MPIIAGIPALIAILAVVCALRPHRRLIGPVLALAALNVVLTPFTSGEWFYQRAEKAAYRQAVAKGNFNAFEDLLDRHDPHLLPRMIALAAGLLLSVVFLAVLQFRAGRGKPASTAISVIATGTVLAAAAATIVQVFFLLRAGNFS